MSLEVTPLTPELLLRFVLCHTGRRGALPQHNGKPLVHSCSVLPSACHHRLPKQSDTKHLVYLTHTEHNYSYWAGISSSNTAHLLISEK